MYKLSGLFILFIFLGCSQKEVVKLGFTAGLSGRYSEIGISARNGVELAVSEINKDGGINGRPVELIIKNNEGDPEILKKVLNELIEEKVVTIFGPLISKMAKTSLETIKNKNILVISPTISSDDISNIDDNFIRLAGVTSGQAESIIKQVKERGYKNVAVVYDIFNKAYTESLYNAFEENMKKQNVVISYVNSLENREKESFKDIALHIKDSNAEAVFIITSGIDAGTLTLQLDKLNVDIAKYGTSWTKTTSLMQTGGKSVEGMILVSTYEADVKSEKYLNFRDAYFEMFNKEPTFISAFFYESLYVFKDGAKKIKKLTPDSIKKSILEIKTFKGLEQEFEINEFGDTKREFSIFIVKNGQFELLK